MRFEHEYRCICMCRCVNMGKGVLVCERWFALYCHALVTEAYIRALPSVD